MTDLPPHELADRLEQQRKELRYLDRAYCPKDDRLVAAVVTYEGEPHAWILGGGRLGNSGAWERDIADMRGMYAADIQTNRARFERGEVDAEAFTVRAETLTNGLERVEKRLRDIREHRPIPRELGWAGKLSEVAHTPRSICPGCGRPQNLEFDPPTRTVVPGAD